ncbi:MAG: hypothetical protein ACE5Z5_09630 [Candidatus Bathyarchaeia archaeon]
MKHKLKRARLDKTPEKADPRPIEPHRQTAATYDKNINKLRSHTAEPRKEPSKH